MSDLIAELKSEILKFDADVKSKKVGEISEVGDGICRIYGLSQAKAGELLKIKTKNGSVSAMALSLEEGQIGAVILGSFDEIAAGDQVEATGEVVKVPAGKAMIGRVVDALGNPIDDKGPIKAEAMMEVEKVAPGLLPEKALPYRFKLESKQSTLLFQSEEDREN